MWIISSCGVSAQIKLAKKYHQKATTFLEKNKASENYFSVDEKGVSMYADANQKSVHHPEFTIYWNELDTLKILFKSFSDKQVEQILSEKGTNYFSKNIFSDNKIEEIKSTFFPTSNKKLNGLKIAIDPGHIGGPIEMARTESRCLEMNSDSGKNAIQLIEGNETFSTAYLLKQKLEAQGAVVMLTKNAPGMTAFDISYAEWKNNFLKPLAENLYNEKKISLSKKKFLLATKNEKERFAFFSPLDLEQRAKKMNDFQPDISVIIHYNVDEKNKGWQYPTKKDFCMTFAGACFTGSALENKFQQIAFLRLLLTDDLEHSIALSKITENHFHSDLDIPIAKPEDAEYLTKNSIYTNEKGVYLRDLMLARLVKGTIVYGETLYQDNVRECVLLNEKTLDVDGVPTSPRIAQVADAYYKAVLEYVNKDLKK
ncbi:MAG: N-acetylmuramoyl-L-alanine amidase [Bacteroidia bacterium]